MDTDIKPSLPTAVGIPGMTDSLCEGTHSYRMIRASGLK